MLANCVCTHLGEVGQVRSSVSLRIQNVIERLRAVPRIQHFSFFGQGGGQCSAQYAVAFFGVAVTTVQVSAKGKGKRDRLRWDYDIMRSVCVWMILWNWSEEIGMVASG